MAENNNSSDASRTPSNEKEVAPDTGKQVVAPAPGKEVVPDTGKQTTSRPMENEKEAASYPPSNEKEVRGGTESERDLVNTSGHVQEIDRTFSVTSICFMSVLTDNAWGAGGGSLVVSLYNGGGPGVLYGLIAACTFYAFIAASLAELASALPTSANVYHWASVTAGPRYGKLVSFYAGWWNCLAWIFGAASVSLFGANTIIAMYSVYHPDYVPQRWQVYICFLVITWSDLSLLLFGQRFVAKAFTSTGILLLLIFLVVTLVCAIMPSTTGYGYASNSFVWTDFENLTGWSSDGLVFVMGILNGAYAIGTPCAATHLAEEVPNPRRNVPIGILAQMTVGTITTFVFYISLLYSITSLNDVFATRIVALPLAGIFQQATRSQGGTFALLFLFFIDQILNLPGAYITAGRMMWTLARDDAVPFSRVFRKVDKTWRNPFWAQVLCGCCVTVLGAIYVGNATAFTAFVGCFAILTTWSYCAAILPHILTGRKMVRPGPFWMPSSVAYVVSGIACAYILVFNVLYMFPYVYPVTVAYMNYACVMSGGLTILLTIWYLWKRTHGYVGPKVILDGHDDIIKGVVGLTKEEEEEMRRASLH